MSVIVTHFRRALNILATPARSETMPMVRFGDRDIVIDDIFEAP